jgi:hypothetical protein
MSRIFGNIEHRFLPVLRRMLSVLNRADFCVGYFSLHGWKQIDSHIEQWLGGDVNYYRLLVGRSV